MRSFDHAIAKGANKKIYIACFPGMLIATLLFCATSMATNDKAKDYEILLIGNSHSSRNNLPGVLAALIEAGPLSKSAHVRAAPNWGFLADHLQDRSTHRLLASQSWTHVILQGQKYSTSGRYSYPTEAAEEWIRRAKIQGAVPIMFPEWPRRGNTEEGQRIHELHLQIVAREPACVAPVGLTWEKVLRQYPSLEMYASDGNHSNPTGTLLTAYVLYEAITGKPATELPDLPSIKVSPETQIILRRGLADSQACSR